MPSGGNPEVSSQSGDLEQISPQKMGQVFHAEHCAGVLSQDDLDFLANFDPAHKAKVLRKVDLRLIPMMMLLYLMAYLDKTNIGNAQIEGMTEDLHLFGIRYNVVSSVFFITFVLCEIPSNMILHKIARPSWYMAAIVFLWGTIMTLSGLVKSYGAFIAIRLLLGVFEGGFLPGAILIISKWYLPNETQIRIAFLYTSAATGGAVSGLLAYGIVNLDGVGGLEGWRWIFILEGLATVVVAVGCIFFLCDSPALSTRWLEPDEIRYLELRQVARRVSAPTEFRDDGNHFGLAIFKDIFCDYKIYLLIFANWSNAVPNYALKFTMPAIIQAMGFKATSAQLLTIPPYMLGAVSSCAFAIFADKFSWRYPFIVVPQVLVVVAFGMLFGLSSNIKDNLAACYFALCLSTFSMYPILPGVNAWNVANTPNPAKRSVNIGVLIAVGNIGGLIGSYIYLAEQKPRYPVGYGTSLGFAAAGIAASTLLELLLKLGNKKKASMTEDEIHAKYSDEQLERMGEKSPLFKYAL
ncbi:hypothetical protein SEUCBS139899_004871 [Sporothrix eucalyptigena]|uniref:Major facilitator superfamily (MFS) profile domain-containing protein n=1 Tax=Sporothrix eucalyptigena TaxID=1812306 RepID=A0ABP0CV46_9PEZI